MLDSRSYVNGRPAEAEAVQKSTLDSADIVTYFYYSPQAASECGWHRAPTGVTGVTSSDR